MNFLKEITTNLIILSDEIGSRPTGTISNLLATTFLTGLLEDAGISVDWMKFIFVNWTDNNTELKSGNITIPALTGPYSSSVSTVTEVVTANSITELENIYCHDKILLIYGDLTCQPYYPKNFPFYSDEEQLKILSLIENKKPVALLTESCNPNNLTPVINDGDFNIPSAVIPIGAQKDLPQNTKISLTINTTIVPDSSANIIAKIPGKTERKRIVFSAHFDTVFNSPGALDNGSGVIAAVIIAKKLNEKRIDTPVEIVLFNGEECYNLPGEQEYLKTNISDTVLAINIDGIGLNGYETAYSTYNLEDMPKINEFLKKSDLKETEPWPQGDHTLFVMNSIPTIALTTQINSEAVMEIMHTAKDTHDKINVNIINQVIDIIEALIRKYDIEYDK